MKLNKNLRTAFGWVIILAIGWFFYRTLSDNWDNLEGVDLHVDTWATIGLLAFVGAVVTSGWLWGRLLAVLSGERVGAADAIRIHSASWLLKYVPGQVSSYINKLLWGQRQGFSKKIISTSFVYENVLMVIAGFALAVPVLLVLAGNRDWTQLVVPLLMVIPMIAVLNRRAFLWMLNLFSRLVRRDAFSADQLLASRYTLKYQFAYAIPRLLNGVGFVLIAQSILAVEPGMYVGLGATYILASIIGLLAIFVPGGLGVREAVIVTFASVYFPIEQATVLAIVTRLYATLSDIGVAVIYLILNKGRIRQR